MKRILAILAVVLAIPACKSRDSDVVGPGKITITPSRVVTPIREGTTGEPQITSAPKVDILFVLDDSESMDNYIARLKDNVHRLVESLVQAKAIDVRIAFTKIWDATRYTTGIVQPTCTLSDGSVHVNYIADGAAFPVKLPKGQEDQFKSFAGRNYVSTQEDGAKQVLEESIMIEVQHLVQNKPGKPPVCESGPIVESILSPIHESLFTDYNKTFWRDDSLKVFMVLSDAKEGAGEDALTLDAIIRAKVGAPPEGPQDKYRVYIAGMVPDTRVDLKTCKPDFGFQLIDPKTGQKSWPSVIPNHEIAKMAKLSGGQIFSICDPNYGDELAKFADDIKKVSLKNKHIKLSAPVDINPKLPPDKQFKLKLGKDDLVQGELDKDLETITAHADWAYDNQHDEVVVRGDFWNDHPGAGITVVYVPVPPKSK